MFRLLTLGGAALVMLAACATPTPYGPASTGGGYGFSDQRIEENRYRITFRGNSLTSRETVENSLLFRAAELTLDRGYDFFIAVENDTEMSTSYRSSGPAFYGRYGYGRPFHRPYYAFPYYAYGFGWGSPYDDYYTREITRYSAVTFIVMYRGSKPDDNPQAFDARSVLNNLGPIVLGDQAGASRY
ncbi:CC0125/CC1285 family lipoprotein [Hyphococcus sp.]|uniref:CC0125/CC1285 family lipoprotein n=1 Tax=Hyphococcus sp. TaxID=2038636 RepID=UPI003CCBA14F